MPDLPWGSYNYTPSQSMTASYSQWVCQVLWQSVKQSQENEQAQGHCKSWLLNLQPQQKSRLGLSTLSLRSLWDLEPLSSALSDGSGIQSDLQQLYPIYLKVPCVICSEMPSCFPTVLIRATVVCFDSLQCGLSPLSSIIKLFPFAIAAHWMFVSDSILIGLQAPDLHLQDFMHQSATIQLMIS